MVAPSLASKQYSPNVRKILKSLPQHLVFSQNVSQKVYHLIPSTVFSKHDILIDGRSFIVYLTGEDTLLLTGTSKRKRKEYFMRKIIVLTFITLDGVMQAPGGPGEDDSGGFTYGGWTLPYFDDFLGKVMTEQMSKPFDLLLGRKTFEIFASYWPYHEDEATTLVKLIWGSRPEASFTSGVMLMTIFP